jgi:hypothetical protein
MERKRRCRGAWRAPNLAHGHATVHAPFLVPKWARATRPYENAMAFVRGHDKRVFDRRRLT